MEIEDRRIDLGTRDRIDRIQDNIDSKFKTLWHWCFFTGLLLVISLYIGALYLQDNRGRSDRINESRRTNMYNSCRDQNSRNINTKKTLHRNIQAAINSGQISAAGGAASEQFTTLLINQLAPIANCKKILTGDLTTVRVVTVSGN